MSEELRFGYNTSAARYVDLRTGRFVARDMVVGVMEDRIADGMGRARDMLAAVVDGGAPVGAWQASFALELKRMHTQMAALGKGGWSQMTPSDWGKVGAQLRFEYQQLRQFARQIANGDLSIAQIEMRMDMYANHVWTSYWGGQTSAAEAAGFTEERRLLQAGESCPDCVGYQAMGWQPLGTLPEPGQDSVCKANCKCIKEYR